LIELLPTIMKTRCFIKQNLQNYKLLSFAFSSKMVENVCNLYEVQTLYIQIRCANFNKFEKFSKKLWPKTHYDKNNKIMT